MTRRKPKCKRCLDSYGSDCSCEMTDRFVFARNEMNNLFTWLEAIAYLAARSKSKRPDWYARTLGGEPKNQSDLILKICEVVKQKAIAIGDNERCNNNCKSLYFCERKIAHKGKHSDGGLKW